MDEENNFSYYTDPYSDMSGFYTDPWAADTGGYDLASMFGTGGDNYDFGNLFDFTSSDLGGTGSYDFGDLFGMDTAVPTYDPYGMSNQYDFGTGTYDFSPVDTAGLTPYQYDFSGNQDSMLNSSIGNLLSGTGAESPDFGVTGLGGSPEMTSQYPSDITNLVNPSENVLGVAGGSNLPYTDAEIDPLKFSMLNASGIGGVNAEGVDQFNSPTVYRGLDGAMQIIGTNGRVEGTFDSTGTFRPGATTIADANAQSQAVKASSGGAGSGMGGGGAQPKTATEPKKTSLQQGLANAALIMQMINALGNKGVKPPKPADSKSATAMSWKRLG